MELCSLSAVEMLEKLDTKEVSSRDLVDAHIERIEKLDFRINSIVHRFFSDARTAADESDQRRAKSKSRKKRPLEGLPFTLERIAFDAQYTGQSRRTSLASSLAE